MGFLFVNVPYNKQPRKLLWQTKITKLWLIKNAHFQVCINYRQARTMQTEVCH